MRLRPPGMPVDPPAGTPDGPLPDETAQQPQEPTSGREGDAGHASGPDDRDTADGGEQTDLERDADGRVRVRFRAARFRAVLGLAGALLALLLALLDGDPGRRWAAALAAVALLVFGVRELLVPERLVADPDGVTVVVGFAGHRRLPWAQVERVRLDVRSRLGLRTQLLEIDVGETLYLFSQGELGMPCSRAVELVRRVRLDG